jgi:hypothetical protein
MSKAILHYLFSNDDIKKIISKKPKKKNLKVIQEKERVLEFSKF